MKYKLGSLFTACLLFAATVLGQTDSVKKSTLTATLNNITADLNIGAGRTLDVSAGTLTLADSQIAGTKVSGLVRTPLRKTYDKIDRISSTENIRLTWLVSGDSLGFGKPLFILPHLRKKLGESGFIGRFAGNNLALEPNNGGGATVFSGTDYTMSPTGDYVTIDASGEYSGGIVGNGTADMYPYTTIPTVSLTADKVMLFYIQEPGAGVIKLQVSADGSTYTDVSGYDAISADGALSMQAVTATISAQVVKRVRALWVSGSTKVFGGGAYSSTARGLVIADLSRGGIDMGSFAGGLGAATLVNAIAPDVVSFEAFDGAASAMGSTITANLTACNALWPNADKIYLGINQTSTWTLSETQAYNAAVKTFTDSVSGYFFDTLQRQGTYAIANALGWMADGTHPNRKFLHLAASELYRESGLSSALDIYSIVNAADITGTATKLYVGGTAGTTSSYGVEFATDAILYRSGIGELTFLGNNGGYGSVVARATGNPAYFLHRSGAGSNAKNWALRVEGDTSATFRVFSDSLATSNPFITFNRTGSTATSTLINSPLVIGLGGTSMTKVSAGTATLVSGAVTVSDTSTTANSIILVNRFTDGGTVGSSYSITRTASTSFTITSKEAGATQTLDTSVITYIKIEP